MHAHIHPLRIDLRRAAHRLALVALAVGLAASMLPGPARPAAGQTLDDRGRLEEELRRTDEILRDAEEAVAASESDRARHLLRNANHIQETAWNLFASCGASNLRACRAAAEATIRARRGARHAVQVARLQSSEERAAQQAIDRAQEMLDLAYNRLRDDNVDNEHALRLLGQAQNQLERAREQFRERHFAVALQLAQSSMRLVQQALNMASGQDWQPDRIERELARTQRLIERAASIIHESGNERAGMLLGQAVRLQENARSAFLGHRFAQAVRLTREARDLVHRALRLVEGPVDAGLVERAIQQTDALIARAQPIVHESNSERARRLFDKGLDRQRHARELLAQGHLRPALAQTRVARNLVSEALEIARRAAEELSSPSLGG